MVLNDALNSRTTDGLLSMESPAKVLEVIPHGSEAVSVRFERPAGFAYLPGQYMFITLGSGPSQLIKHLTISSSPTEPFLQVTKKMTGHPFATALAALRAGDVAILRGPFGDFTFTGEFEKVAFLSGGIGITPLRSMMRYAADTSLMTDITFLYSARTGEEILFRSEFAELTASNPHLSIVVTLTRPGPGWNGHTGRIDRTFVETEIPDWRERVFFTCGPAAMVDAISSLLKEMGVLPDRIRAENFPGY